MTQEQAKFWHESTLSNLEMLSATYITAMDINRSLSRNDEFFAGCRGILPLIISAIPFGIIFGAVASNSGFSLTGTIAMSAFVFAGSSQFIAISLLNSTAIPLIILTVFVVNLRHLIYAVSLIPYIQHLPQIWKFALGFWLTDEAFAVAIARYGQTDKSPYKHWYHLGAALFLYVNWQLFTIAGFTLGNFIPNADNWGLDFVMSATFIGLLIPYLINKPMMIAVVVSGAMALVFHTLPYNLGLIVATLSGVISGISAEKLYVR
jgi:4-azaleucine resistance transporter AzlC